MEEERLDKLLVQRNLVSTRVRAEKIIKEDGVKVDGKLITKTGKRFPIDCDIELVAEEIPWVSRGALKLLGALEKWSPMIKGKTMMDIGACTGGFTEVLLSKGAKKIYAIDVGRDQLHPSLLENEKVINLQKTHVRELNNNLIPELVDGCVIDVSFISLEKIFPFFHSFIQTGGFVIVLIKPQFEVGKENVGKGGIVKDKKLYPTVIKNIQRLALTNHFKYIDHIPSPILGGDGNQEFLMYLQKIDFNFTPPTFNF